MKRSIPSMIFAYLCVLGGFSLVAGIGAFIFEGGEFTGIGWAFGLGVFPVALLISVLPFSALRALAAKTGMESYVIAMAAGCALGAICFAFLAMLDSTGFGLNFALWLGTGAFVGAGSGAFYWWTEQRFTYLLNKNGPAHD